MASMLPWASNKNPTAKKGSGGAGSGSGSSGCGPLRFLTHGYKGPGWYTCSGAGSKPYGSGRFATGSAAFNPSLSGGVGSGSAGTTKSCPYDMKHSIVLDVRTAKEWNQGAWWTSSRFRVDGCADLFGLTLAILPGHVACATRIDYQDSALITKVRQALTKMPASGIKSPDSCAGAHAHQFAGACSCARREKHPGGRILPFWKYVESMRAKEHTLARASWSTGEGVCAVSCTRTKARPPSAAT